jgi:predicted  nucleic acid-binding Zn-ribbon protein
MNADLKKLIRLQEVDLSVEEYRTKIEAFPVKSKALDVKLASALQGVLLAKKAIEASQSKHKEHEAKVSDLEAKISKHREQLMSVKTNTEYKAMTKEIEFSQEAISKQEDHILAIMEQADELAGILKSAEATLTEDESMVLAERSKLSEENVKDLETHAAYVDERNQLSGGIDEAVFARYERVRNARGGVALARAADEMCTVCNVKMRPQRFQEVRQNDQIFSCESCSRILYDPENMDHPFEVA